MPLFTYEAVDRSGVTSAGELTAASRPVAVDILSRRGLVPTRVSAAASHSSGIRWSPRDLLSRLRRDRGVNARELLNMTRSVAVLLRAGLTMDRALSIAVALMESREGKRTVERLKVAVRAGASLSEALGREKLPLPPYYATMVQAGEAGGSLADTLARLSDALKDRMILQERIRSALTYPIVLAFIVLFTLVVLLAFVLPKFRILFAEADVRLPLSTRIVLQLGDLAQRYWWAALVVGLAGAVSLTAFMKTPRGQAWWDRRLLVARWTFGLPLKLNTARVLRTLGTLLQSGVVLPNAIRIARGTLANVHLRHALHEVGSRVSSGQSLSEALVAVAVFPAHAVQLARVGEESGTLQPLLLEAASILENEAQTSLERLLTLLVPILTIGMGAIVAALIGSVLIGLLSINDLAV
jgi:general secretion pathway protein F